jgi:hypothetical protein
MAFAIGLALAILAACSNGGDAAPGPSDPDIRGVITSLSDGSGDVVGSVRIEGDIAQDTTYDKAVVRVEGDTRILRQVGDAMMEVTFADLSVGQTVEAWFTGPVAESYPVQVKASQIVIVG